MAGVNIILEEVGGTSSAQKCSEDKVDAEICMFFKGLEISVTRSQP